MSNFNELIHLETFDLTDPVVVSLLEGCYKRSKPNSFILSDFRSTFKKENFIKKNSLNFVYPKYLGREVFYGRGQMISGIVFKQQEDLLEKLGLEIIFNYIEVYANMYQINQPKNPIDPSQYRDFATTHKIMPIINFYKHKNVNYLLQQFYSMVYIYLDCNFSHARFKKVHPLLQKSYSTMLRIKDKYATNYYNAFRGDNNIIPFFERSNKSIYKRIIFDLLMCCGINAFVAFNKIFNYFKKLLNKKNSTH